MPMIGGNYFSKKDIDRDKDFLVSQGLTDDQVSAVSAYFLQRLSNAIWTGGGVTLFLVAFLFGLFFL